MLKIKNDLTQHLLNSNDSTIEVDANLLIQRENIINTIELMDTIDYISVEKDSLENMIISLGNKLASIISTLYPLDKDIDEKNNLVKLYRNLSLYSLEY